MLYLVTVRISSEPRSLVVTSVVDTQLVEISSTMDINLVPFNSVNGVDDGDLNHEKQMAVKTVNAVV